MATSRNAPSFEHQTTVAAEFATQHDTLQESVEELPDSTDIPEVFPPRRSGRMFAVMALAAVGVLVLIGWLVHQG